MFPTSLPGWSSNAFKSLVNTELFSSERLWLSLVKIAICHIAYRWIKSAYPLKLSKRCMAHISYIRKHENVRQASTKGPLTHTIAHISATRIVRHPPHCARGGDWLETCQQLLPTHSRLRRWVGHSSVSVVGQRHIQRPHMPSDSLPTTRTNRLC